MKPGSRFPIRFFCLCVVPQVLGFIACDVSSSRVGGPGQGPETDVSSDTGTLADVPADHSDGGIAVHDAGTPADTGPHGLSLQKTFGTVETNQAYAVATTSEGGLIVGGHTRDLLHPNYEFWLLKLDESLNDVWQKRIRVNTTGGYRHQNGPFDVRETPDGGYIMTAAVIPPGQDLVNHWMFKFTATGVLEWQKAYAIGYMTAATTVTKDGSFLLTGPTSCDSGPSCSVLMKISSDGTLRFVKGYRGYNLYSGQAIETPDGGYLVLGSADEAMGLVFMCDATGMIIWQKILELERPYGSSFVSSVVNAPGGGFLLTGARSSDSDSAWLMKLSANGEVVWEKIYRRSGWGLGRNMWVSGNDTVFLVAWGGDYPVTPDGLWMLNLDRRGEINWQRAYNMEEDVLGPVVERPDGSLAAVGWATHPGADGSNDAWVVVTNPDGSVDENCPPALGGATDASAMKSETVVRAANLEVLEVEVPITDTDAEIADGDLSEIENCRRRFATDF